MFLAGIQQKPGAGFDDRGKLILLEQCLHFLQSLIQTIRIGIQTVMIDGQCHRLVAGLGQQLNRVIPAMKGQAIRIVSRFHRSTSLCCNWNASR